MKGRPFDAVLFSANVLLREGLVRILRAADFNIVACRAFSDDGVLPSPPHEPDVLLIVDASDDFDAAIKQIAALKLRYPNGRIAVLVSQHQVLLPQMLSAFRRGASAYLTNFTTPEAFVKSLELVMLGEAVLPTAMLTELLNHLHGHSDNGGNHTPRLSAREMDIVRCLVEGNSNKVIARKMKIADATVKVHVKAILRKIRVANRTQVAIWAMRNGSLISPNHDGLFYEEEPRVQRETIEPPALHILSPEGKDDATFSAAVENEGANHVTVPGLDCAEWKGLR
jgi:DNA-binding NarL/FixJ family response regulator